VPILPQAPLPAITVPVTIDGTTQPGYAGTPLIQLDGSFTFFDAGQQTGLDIAAGSTTVRGLDIRYWRDQGVILEGKGNDALAGDVIDHNLATTGPVIGTPCGICITSPNNTIGGTDAGARNLIFANANAIDISGSGAGGNVVEGNYIGTTSGPGNISNGDGILIDGSPGNTIGGTAPGARNVISGNDYDGVHINGAGASGNTVEGNYIGVDPTGTTQVHNGKYGVEVTQAPNNTIGGTAVGAGNVISGNEFGNVFIVGTSATGNLLAGNYIGTDATGEQALRPEVNVYSGGGVFLAAPDTTIGGTSPAARNVISGNGGDGVAISREEIISFTGPTTVTIYTADHELVEGNYIGVDARGTARLGNGGYGVTMGNTNNTVGGTTAGARNVISGNGHAGVLISGGLGGLGGNEATYATDDAVQGNYIGTDATGAASIGNTGAGVLIEVGKYATNNTVSGNVISGNGGAGVDLQANSNAVQGNDIGTDASGHKALPNQTGVKVEDENNTIGGTAAGTGNVISGNTGDGVDIYFASDPNGPASTDTTLVQGNYIGTDASGVSALGNSGSGVLVSGQNVTSTTIGGTGSGARNIISGNKLQGIEIDGQGGDTVQGNDIGTDATGATLLANGGGIDVTAPDNTIGGTAHGAGNLIDGTGAGIGLAGKGNTVQGNTIGTNAAGTAKLSRFYYGVQVTASSNAIGGTVPGAGNVITGGYGGVLVTGAAAGGNPILGNSIFGNVLTPSPGHTISGGGIALTQGGNGSELPPVLAPLRNSTTTTTISGLVKPGTHRIEVFRNDSCTDPEGKTLVGVVITTKTTWSLTVGKLAGGQGVTATSTNTAASNTSPFSACKVTPRT
jgi:titin